MLCLIMKMDSVVIKQRYGYEQGKEHAYYHINPQHAVFIKENYYLSYFRLVT